MRKLSIYEMSLEQLNNEEIRQQRVLTEIRRLQRKKVLEIVIGRAKPKQKANQ
jgi:hypothetical protein